MAKKIPTSFMDGPLVEHNCTVYTYMITCLSRYGSIFLFDINK